MPGFSDRPGADKCESVEKQIELCSRYAEGCGYDIKGTYFDKAIGGGRMDNRPGLQEALDHVCRIKGVLVVYSLDRFARNTKDAICMLDRLRKSRADLASITESLNTRSAIGQFLFELLASFAQLQRRQTGERTSDAMRYHQRGGRRMGRVDRCPWGWMPDPLDADRMVVCPEELAVVAAIHELRGSGKTYKVVAQELQARGHSCRGKRWHEATILRILRRYPLPTPGPASAKPKRSKD